MATSAPSLSRTSSAASISSTDDTAGNFSPVIRRTRKRFTSAQLAMLETLFHRNSHPSREEREGVARVGGMEVKSVTIWFQNKRQTERRVALLNSSETLASTTSLASIKGPQPSAPTQSTTSSRPSLDRIASRTELRTSGPRTPTRRRSPGASLWDNMPSSPITSPISPPPLEYAELAKNQRVRRTLEWACAAARLAEKEGINASSLSHPQPRRTRAKVHQRQHHLPHQHRRRHHQRQDHIPTRAQAQAAAQAQRRYKHPDKPDADLTEEESDELVTPLGSWIQEDRWIARPDGAMQPAVVSVEASKCASQGARAQEDDVMRAALALCGLGRRS